MVVSSLGGDMPARQLCPKVNLKIRGVEFIGNLIVFEYVIPGFYAKTMYSSYA
jgi:hypothetical protein